jgi:hypothetical protein
MGGVNRGPPRHTVRGFCLTDRALQLIERLFLVLLLLRAGDKGLSLKELGAGLVEKGRGLAEAETFQVHGKGGEGASRGGRGGGSRIS